MGRENDSLRLNVILNYMINIRPKLSVLIPTYNREHLVKKAIESVLDQPFKDLEVICCDNDSSDRTFDVLKKYQKNDNRVKVYKNERNIGAVLNWKKCLDYASGDFIHWLWSDDWVESNFYNDAFNIMQKENTRLVSTWNYRSDNPDDLSDRYISWRFSYPKVEGEIAAKKILNFDNELPASPAAYILPIEDVRQNFFTNLPIIGELDPVSKAVGVDSLMVIGSCLKQSYISIIQKPSVTFRKHENISTKLHREGTLMKMYAISHLWFIKNSSVKMSLYEYRQFAYKYYRYFRKDVYKINILAYTIKGLIIAVFKINRIKHSNKYKSKKAYFKN